LGVYTIVLGLLYLIYSSKRIDTAGYYLVFFTGTVFPSLPILFGRESGTQFFLFAMIIFPFFYFSRDEKKSVIFATVPVILFVFFLEIWFVSVSPVINVPQNILRIFYYISLASTCFLLLILSYFSFSASIKIKNKIQSLVREKLSFEAKKSDKRKNGKAKYSFSDSIVMMVVSLKISEHEISLKTKKTIEANLEKCSGFFEKLTEKYNLQKINSAGERYVFLSDMEENTIKKQIIKIVLAALEIQYFIETMKNSKSEELFFDFCIGIDKTEGFVAYNKEAKRVENIYGPVLQIAELAEKKGEMNKINVTGKIEALISNLFQMGKRKKLESKDKKKQYELTVLESIRSELTENNEGIVPNEEFYKIYQG